MTSFLSPAPGNRLVGTLEHFDQTKLGGLVLLVEPVDTLREYGADYVAHAALSAGCLDDVEDRITDLLQVRQDVVGAGFNKAAWAGTGGGVFLCNRLVRRQHGVACRGRREGAGLEDDNVDAEGCYLVAQALSEPFERPLRSGVESPAAGQNAA